MSDLKKYLNDPDIADEPMALREIHAIRRKIHDETRHMTPTQRATHANAEALDFIEKYGLKVRLPENNLENDKPSKRKVNTKRSTPTKPKTPTHA